jgi:hypothetical protein
MTHNEIRSEFEAWDDLRCYSAITREPAWFAYLAAAEPREKRIAELEARRARLTEALRSVVEQVSHINHYRDQARHPEFAEILRNARIVLAEEQEQKR